MSKVITLWLVSSHHAECNLLSCGPWLVNLKHTSAITGECMHWWMVILGNVILPNKPDLDFSASD